MVAIKPPPLSTAAPKCEECGEPLIDNEKDGEAACSGCGLVTPIIFPGQMYRRFSERADRNHHSCTPSRSWADLDHYSQFLGSSDALVATAAGHMDAFAEDNMMHNMDCTVAAALLLAQNPHLSNWRPNSTIAPPAPTKPTPQFACKACGTKAYRRIDLSMCRCRGRGNLVPLGRRGR